MQPSAAHVDAGPSLEPSDLVNAVSEHSVCLQGRLPDYNDPVVLPSNRNTVSYSLHPHNAPFTF